MQHRISNEFLVIGGIFRDPLRREVDELRVQGDRLCRPPKRAFPVDGLGGEAGLEAGVKPREQSLVSGH